MKWTFRIGLASFVLLAHFSISGAEEWNGIRPLYTTRAEVEKKLGNPKEKLYDGCWVVYETAEERIEIDYLCFICKERAGLNDKEIPLDTVLRVFIRPLKDLKFSDLGLDINKFVRSEGHIPGDIGYSNQKDGIGVGMAFEKVNTITYFAPEDVYKQFICK
jgi:hypothetical protein